MNHAIYEALNLSENEKAVLDALMSFKWPQNTTTIAKKSDLPRTTVTYILKRFEARYLARKTPKLDARIGDVGKRMHWMFNKRSSYL